jgi:hypothetical protein
MSALAGADLRGADLTLFKHADGTTGYKVEVPVKNSKNGETEIVTLSDWLEKASKDQIKQLLPNMVFQNVRSAEFEVTNFGGNNQKIIDKLSSDGISKAYDYSPMDPTKNFSGHQAFDPEKPYYDDKWSETPDKVNMLTPIEYRHKMAIEARYILDDMDSMDEHVKGRMVDKVAVNDAMEQMVQNLVDQGQYNEAFAKQGKESPDAHRERLRKAVFNDEDKINRRLEAFFRKEYIAEQAGLPKTKDAVNSQYGSFESSDARAEFLRGESVKLVEDPSSPTGRRPEMGKLQKHELGALESEVDGTIVKVTADLEEYKASLLKAKPVSPPPVSNPEEEEEEEAESHEGVQR